MEAIKMGKKVESPKGTLECRSFSSPDFRAISEGNVIEGHAAVFGQVANIGGWFEEIVERTAFDKTDFSDVLCSVVNHDMRIPVARSRKNNANSTMQLSVDDQGLLVKANLDTARNHEAAALYSAVDRGDISGMSCMFRVRGEKWERMDSDLPLRRITDISWVREVTPASIPAYAGTDINARDQSALESAQRVLENARSEWLESQEGEQAAIRQLKEALLGKAGR
jgi:HK97 family phage prohead protease